MRAASVLFGVSAVLAAAPDQIHISYTTQAGELAVDFVAADSSSGYVAFAAAATGPFQQSPSTSFAFPTVGTMHQAVLSLNGTTAGSAFYYKVGTAAGESEVFTVYPTPARGEQEKFVVFGDFGLANDKCLPALIADAKANVFDSVLHVGDWAYNFEDGFSLVGNTFMNLIQPYAAIKPVMPAVGNHEACGTCAAPPKAPDAYFDKNMTQYKARLHAVSRNSNTGNNQYYSFNRGLTHFIVFSAEAYLYARSEVFLANQLAFMQADLAAVDRKVTPWVVGLCHKDWTMEAEAFAAFSPVLEAGGVDVTFVGHVHYYNRFLPYNPMEKVSDAACVSADGSTYTNPKYMVSIVTGAAGNHEDESGYVKGDPSYTGVENYGYGFFQALNATVATWDFKTIVANKGPKDYTDHLTIVQTGRGH